MRTIAGIKELLEDELKARTQVTVLMVGRLWPAIIASEIDVLRDALAAFNDYQQKVGDYQREAKQ